MTVNGLDILGFCHVGLVVHDLDDFFGTWGALLGTADPARVDNEQAAGKYQLHGSVVEEPTASRVAFFAFHGTAIEVIQPVHGQAASSQWLRSQGPGVNHLAFWVRDLTTALVSLGDTAQVTYSPAALGGRPARALVTSDGAADIGSALAPQSPPEDASAPFWAYVEPWANPSNLAIELLDAGLADEFRRRFGRHVYYPGDLPSVPPGPAPA